MGSYHKGWQEGCPRPWWSSIAKRRRGDRGDSQLERLGGRMAPSFGRVIVMGPPDWLAGVMVAVGWHLATETFASVPTSDAGWRSPSLARRGSRCRR
jgi:hypothetical protein